ncbi:hypothetical protein SEA_REDWATTLEHOG_168 [Gordonia phage RedWattleHog]|uniref:Uncharacterized protein n=1 Tax=Gordonia phage Stormageddon TaxID=2656541 RepID=A0A649VSV2_9CAUD|nr:hypothetical protein KHQ86_gp131 [Gordonia phage Stormageddon]QGJ95029.1 hypothetical protein SEA_STORMAGEDDON_169 [Gordonia phage Stormageddon]QLF83671.1 hypothetical protein SEA_REDWATTLEHOG_168 [Gordonia phage RedWattleHog]
MKITKVSALSGKTNEMDLDITEDRLLAWQNAADDDPNRFVQHAFPDLTDDEREFLITGVTQEEWDATFPPEEEDMDEADWVGR